MKLVNLTPHKIDVYGINHILEGPIVSYPASGMVARVASIELGTQIVGDPRDISNQLVYELVEYGHLEGVPQPEEDTGYIVSLVAALAARGRNDLLAPYIEVRNESGTMIGCRYLQKIC